MDVTVYICTLPLPLVTREATNTIQASVKPYGTTLKGFGEERQPRRKEMKENPKVRIVNLLWVHSLGL